MNDAGFNSLNEKVEETFDVVIMGGALRVTQVQAQPNGDVKAAFVSSGHGTDLGKDIKSYERAYGIAEALPPELAEHVEIKRTRKTIITKTEYTNMVSPRNTGRQSQLKSKPVTVAMSPYSM